MKTLYAGAEGMLPQIKGKLTIRNEKSYSLEVVCRIVSSIVVPLPSIS